MQHFLFPMTYGNCTITLIFLQTVGKYDTLLFLLSLCWTWRIQLLWCSLKQLISMNSNTIFRLYTQGRSPMYVFYRESWQHDICSFRTVRLSPLQWIWIFIFAALLEYHLMGQIKVKLYCIPQNCHYPLTCSVAHPTVYVTPCETVVGLFRIPFSR